VQLRFGWEKERERERERELWEREREREGERVEGESRGKIVEERDKRGELFCDPITPSFLPFTCPHGGIRPDSVSSFKAVSNGLYYRIIASLSSSNGSTSTSGNGNDSSSGSSSGSSSSSRGSSSSSGMDMSDSNTNSYWSGISSPNPNPTVDITNKNFYCKACCEAKLAGNESQELSLIKLNKIVKLLKVDAHPEVESGTG
jgi:hypothetical protein